MISQTETLADLQQTKGRKKYSRSHGLCYTVVCDVCGREFATAFSRKRRCSWECQEQYHRLATLRLKRRQAEARKRAREAVDGQ